MAATVAVAMAMAYRFRPVLWPGMPGMPDDGMDRYRELLAPRMTWVIAGAAIVMGLFAGGSATGQWRNYSLWRHGTSFGTEDPYFNKDVGFYVFDLPFWHYVVDYVMALAVVGLLATVLVNYLFGGIRLSARPGDRLTSAAQIQVSALLALFVLAKAVDYWLDRFDLVTNSGSIFTGMDYTGDKAVLPAKEILAGIAVVCAVLFVANIWRRTWLLPSVGVALFALSAIILGLIVPSVVQAIRVNPNVPDRQGPYMEENIDATRQAFKLDQIEEEHVHRYAGRLRRRPRGARRHHLIGPARRPQGRQPRPSSSSSRCVPTTPSATSSTSTATRSTARSARSCSACASSTRTASPRTTRTGPTSTPCTRTATESSRRTPTSGPRTTRARPPASSGPRARRRTRTRWAGSRPRATRPASTSARRARRYSIVGSREGANPIELDLATDSGADASEEQDRLTTYTGSGGVPIGNVFNKLLYAVKYSASRTCCSPAGCTSDSKILYDRDAARHGGEGRAVAHRGLRPLSGGDRREDPVDPRRLHRHGQVPRVPARVVRDDDRGRAAAGQRVRRRCRPTR